MNQRPSATTYRISYSYKSESANHLLVEFNTYDLQKTLDHCTWVAGFLYTINLWFTEFDAEGNEVSTHVIKREECI
jgi:hypothetical protein